MNHFSNNLRILRKAKGFSQEKLSKATGISRESIGSYEESRATPSIDRLLAIADFFKISLDQLVRDKIELDIKVSIIK